MSFIFDAKAEFDPADVFTKAQANFRFPLTSTGAAELAGTIKDALAIQWPEAVADLGSGITLIDVSNDGFLKAPGVAAAGFLKDTSATSAGFLKDGTATTAGFLKSAGVTALLPLTRTGNTEVAPSVKAALAAQWPEAVAGGGGGGGITLSDVTNDGFLKDADAANAGYLKTAGVTALLPLTKTGTVEVSSSVKAALAAQWPEAVSGADSVFNGARAITRAVTGLQGVTPGGTTLGEVLESLLYPAVGPTATMSVNSPTREIGANPAYTLTWTVTKNTNPITGITVDSVAVTPTGFSQGGTKPGTLGSTTGTHTRSMSVTDGTLTDNKSATVTYLARMYFDTINHNTGITDTEIRALAGSELRSNLNKSLTNFGGGGKYLIFVIPTSFGTPTFTVNGLENNAFTTVRANSPFVNNEGATVTVNVIVSNSIYNSSLSTLVIS